MELYEDGRPTSLNDIPPEVFRHCILTTDSIHGNKDEEESATEDGKKKRKNNSYFTSKELFMFRGVCGSWLDAVRVTWCRVVKDEILEQVQSLEFLYEKKMLLSYSLIINTFSSLNFNSVVRDIVGEGDTRGLIICLIC